MELVINTYGAFLRKKEDCFEVKIDDKTEQISPKKVDKILITTGAIISTDAIYLALENNIEIYFLDQFGNPMGKIWHSKLGSTTAIRRRQLEISETEQGLELVKEWLTTKISYQIEFLTELKLNRSSKSSEIQDFINKMEEYKNLLVNLKGTVPDLRDMILGLEGSISRIYFQAISFILPEPFKFNERSRNPAKDEFNCLLNYGYGILYSMVEKACIIAGLDPYIGILHTDNYNKKSFVFDIIELFRIFVDRLVVHLFSKRCVKKEYFEPVKQGIRLNKEGKAFFIQKFNEDMEETIRYHRRNIKKRDIIQFECHQIANFLIGR